MNNTVNIWMSLEDLVKVLLFSNVDIEEFGSLATDELDAIYGLFRGVLKVVHDHNFVISLQQCEGSERANVAAAPE